MAERKKHGFVDYSDFGDLSAYMPSPTQMKTADGRVDFDLTEFIPFMKGSLDIVDLVRYGRDRLTEAEEFTKDFVGKDKLRADTAAREQVESQIDNFEEADFNDSAAYMRQAAPSVGVDDFINAGAQLQRIGDQVSAELTDAIKGGVENSVKALASDVSSLFFTP